MELIELLLKKYNRTGFKIVSFKELKDDYIGYASNIEGTICFSIQDKKNILISDRCKTIINKTNWSY